MSRPAKIRKKAEVQKFEPNTLAHLDLCIFPNQSVVIKCAKASINGVLKVTNITNNVVHLFGCAEVQQSLNCPQITGDSLPSHAPVGWGHSTEVVFEVLRANADLCKGGNREMPPELLNKITTPGSQWTMEQLQSMVPPVPGSEKRQREMTNYLGYRRSQWSIQSSEELTGTVEARLVLHVASGSCLHSPYTCGPNQKAFYCKDAILGQPIAFIVDDDMSQKTSVGHSAHLDSFFESIGTSGLVSLLQKIIRRKPFRLTHPDVQMYFDSEFVIRNIVQKLLDMRQAGIFLPDRGIYVSAKQHFLKRLMIIMAEDSEYNDTEISKLAIAALLCECCPIWNPSNKVCQDWEDIAVYLWKSDKTSVYNTKMGFNMGPTTFHNFKPSHLACMIHEELGGMVGDRGMLRWLRNSPRNTVIASVNRTTHVDSLDIYCDQHVTGNVVYLWNAREKNNTPSAPYSKELHKAFQLVTGWNTRRKPLPDVYSAHQQAIIIAMKEASRQVRGILSPFPSGIVVNYAWEMPLGTLAGMIAPVEVKHGRKYMFVTVDPNNLDHFVVIPKPSRSSALKDISQREQAIARTQAKKIFKKGVKLSHSPHKSFNGLIAHYQNKTWTVNNIRWEEARNVSFSVQNTLSDNELELNGNLQWEMPPEFSKDVIQWVAGKLTGFEHTVVMPRVSRMGSGTKESLTGLEGRAYSLMRIISQKFPDAIWPIAGFRFHTKCIPLRHAIRDRLIANITNVCTLPLLQTTRTLRPVQQEALDGMLKADKQSMGNFLWMRVGAGKSLTVLSFLDQTRKTNKCIWCLPMTAIKSVIHEIKHVGWSVRVLASSKGRLSHYASFTSESERTLDKMLLPGVITIIEHDDVRNLVDDLAKQMTETAFIYDEVHKAMASQTQRTGAALRLASVAKQMVVLTGTPIVNSRAITLIKWLRFCVPFQVHSRNFWVAANAMIARLTSTKVKTRHCEVSVPIPEDKKQLLFSHLPERHGGNARKPNWEVAYSVSMSIVDDFLVQKTVEIVYSPRGEAPEGCPDKDTTEHAWATSATRALAPSEELFRHLPQRVFLIAATQKHANKLAKMLLDLQVPAKDINIIGNAKCSEETPQGVLTFSSVCYTPEMHHQGYKMPKICIAPISKCEGYSLTWFTCMLSGVYPSNQAKRTQMDGRINRADCERMHRTYITAMAGLTETMFKYQRNAKNLEKALANIGKMDS